MYFIYLLLLFPFVSFACRLKNPPSPFEIATGNAVLAFFIASTFGVCMYLVLRLLPKHKDKGVVWALKRTSVYMSIIAVCSFFIIPILLSMNGNMCI